MNSMSTASTSMDMMDNSMDNMNMDAMNTDNMKMDTTTMDKMNMDKSMTMNMQHMMMFFHTGFREYPLFQELRTESVGAMIGGCFFFFVLGVLYEALKLLREQMQILSQRSETPSVVLVGNGSQAENGNGIVKGNGVVNHRNDAVKERDVVMEKHNPTFGEVHLTSIVKESRRSKIRRGVFNRYHLLQTFIHILQVFISYCLMLVFMTFNVWLCVAVILGAGLGYFLFGWRRPPDTAVDDHCLS